MRAVQLLELMPGVLFCRGALATEQHTRVTGRNDQLIVAAELGVVAVA